jgi:hypothetical protein
MRRHVIQGLLVPKPVPSSMGCSEDEFSLQLQQLAVWPAGVFTLVPAKMALVQRHSLRSLGSTVQGHSLDLAPAVPRRSSRRLSVVRCGVSSSNCSSSSLLDMVSQVWLGNASVARHTRARENF